MNKSDKVLYSKTPKTFIEQIELLKNRGLSFKNEHRAEKNLQYISYSRLSNYWFPMLKEPKDAEIFKENAYFENAFKLYQFDSEFRKITFHAIEQIEIGIRTQIIYHLSHKYKSGFWYNNFEAFKNYPNFIQFLSKITKNTQDTKQEFIKKYSNKYIQFLPPSWKSFELLTFNTLLTILKNLKDPKDIIPISKSFGINHKVFLSWLESLIYFRNICAHHGRLWNIKLTISPTWPKSPQNNWVSKWENDSRNDETNDKILKMYSVNCIIKYCIDQVNPYNTYKSDLIQLLKRFPQSDLNHMGFPKNWNKEPLWVN